jgi:hypothetical protein
MSEDSFEWRGLTFKLGDPEQHGEDFWQCGRWSLSRDFMGRARTLRWTARWYYDAERWENASDYDKPWDKAAALEQLLERLRLRTGRYQPDLAALQQRVTALQQEEKDLIDEIALCLMRVPR